MRLFPPRSLILAACGAVLCATTCGCRSVSSFVTTAAPEMTSVSSGSNISLKGKTTLYVPGPDANTADFYITDLPPEVWEQGGDISACDGNILHVHMFVSPKAGRTPIEWTATSATARWLVLSHGQIGVYGGGGFFLKSGDVGDSSLGGSLDRASVRYLYGTAGFEDLLGPSVLTAGFDAVKDPVKAGAMERTLRVLDAAAAGPGPE